MISQYSIYIVNLDPTKGSEIKKTRPCVVVSPDEMNRHLQTIMIAPMTSTIREYPWRASVSFQDKAGQIALDQLRTVDRSRLMKKAGALDESCIADVKDILHQMLVL